MELKLMSYNIQHGLNYKTRIAPEGKEIIHIRRYLASVHVHYTAAGFTQGFCL